MSDNEKFIVVFKLHTKVTSDVYAKLHQVLSGLMKDLNGETNADKKAIGIIIPEDVDMKIYKIKMPKPKLENKKKRMIRLETS